jgi:hypothetical protein
MTVTQSVNLDTVEADTATNKTSIELIATASPDYAISNDGTVRTLNADAADGTIASPIAAPADVQRNQAAILELSDVVATVIRDLGSKGILG